MKSKPVLLIIAVLVFSAGCADGRKTPPAPACAIKTTGEEPLASFEWTPFNNTAWRIAVTKETVVTFVEYERESGPNGKALTFAKRAHTSSGGGETTEFCAFCDSMIAVERDGRGKMRWITIGEFCGNTGAVIVASGNTMRICVKKHGEVNGGTHDTAADYALTIVSGGKASGIFRICENRRYPEPAATDGLENYAVEYICETTGAMDAAVMPFSRP